MLKLCFLFRDHNSSVSLIWKHIFSILFHFLLVFSLYFLKALFFYTMNKWKRWILDHYLLFLTGRGGLDAAFHFITNIWFALAFISLCHKFRNESIINCSSNTFWFVEHWEQSNFLKFNNWLLLIVRYL